MDKTILDMLNDGSFEALMAPVFKKLKINTKKVNKKVKEITGAGGGGGGGNMADATVRVDSVIRGQEALSEGPIAGLVKQNGDIAVTKNDYAQCVYLNNTPVANADGTLNYLNVGIDFRSGGADNNSPMQGFPDVEAVHTVNANITFAIPHTITVSSGSIDSVRVAISMPNGLRVQDDSGSTNGGSFGWAIDRKPTASSIWENNVAYGTESNVAYSSYNFDAATVVIPPGCTGQWDIRLRRTTPDDAKATSVTAFAFATYTEIQSLVPTYPGTAYVGYQIDAQALNGSIPKRTYLVKGMSVKVPSNYTPGYMQGNGIYQMPVYSGVWNGSWKYAWTNNPVWILMDLLVNATYGLGDFITQDMINPASFYNAAVWCDEPVASKSGPTNGQNLPLYQFNGVLNSQQDAIKMLQTVAGTFASTIIVQGGVICLNQDRPYSSITKMVTNNDIKEGLFTYAGSLLQTRYTACDVFWTDPDLMYAQNTAHYEDAAGIAKYGYNTNQITGFGITGVEQAQRLAKYTVYTSLNTTDIASWTASFNQFDLQVGDVVELYDQDYTETAGTGKVVSVSGNVVTLDQPVQLGASNTLSYYSTDGKTILTNNIAETNKSSTTVTLPVNAGTYPTPGTTYIVTGVVNPRLFRIMSTKIGSNKNEIEVSALAYDANRYNFLLGYPLEAPLQYTQANLSTTPQVTGITFTPQGANDPVRGAYANLIVTWDSQNQLPGFWQYKFQWRRGNGNWTPAVYTPNNTFVIENAIAGVYDVMLQSQNLNSVSSATSVDTYVFGYAGVNNLAPPNAITLMPFCGTGSTWHGTDLGVTWTPDASNQYIPNETVGGYLLRFYDNDTGIQLGNSGLLDVNTTSYVFTKAMNVAGGGPARHIRVEAYTMDVFGNASPTSKEGIFNNPAPAAPSLTLLADADGGTWVTPTNTGDTSQIAGYKIYFSKTPGVTYQTGTLIDDPIEQIGSGIGAPTQVGPTEINVKTPCDTDASGAPLLTQYYFIAAAYDQFSNNADGLNFSSVYSVNVTPSFVYASQLINGAVTAAAIAHGAVGAAQINVPALDANGNLSASAQSQVTVGDGAITTLKLAANAVTAAKTQIAAIDPTSGNLVANSVTSAQIVAGTITGSDIAATTITGANIVGGTITAVQLAAGSVTADKIVAGAITSQALLVGTLTSLTPNGTWATGDLSGWTPDTSARWSVNTTGSTGYASGATAAVVSTPGGATATNVAMYSTNVITCNPNDWYNFTVWAHLGATDTKTSGSIVLKVLQKNGTYNYPVIGTSVTATGYTQINGNYQVQTTDVSIQMGVMGTFNIGNAASVANQTVLFSNAQALRMSGATLIQPGSITTNQIAAGTITGNNISGNTITGYNIQANTIAAGNLVTNSAVITGTAQIQSGVIVDAHITSLNATKITAGQLAAGVVYAGTISANQISANSLSSISANTGSLNVTGNLSVGQPASAGDAWGIIASSGKTWWSSNQPGYILAHNNNRPPSGTTYTFFEMSGSNTNVHYLRMWQDDANNFGIDLNTDNVRILQNGLIIRTSNVIIDTTTGQFVWYGPNFSVDSRNGSAYFSGTLAANIVSTNAIIGASVTRQWSGSAGTNQWLGGGTTNYTGNTLQYNAAPYGGTSNIIIIFGGNVGGWNTGDRGDGSMIQANLTLLTSAYGGKSVLGGGYMYTTGMFSFQASGPFAFRVDGANGNWDFAIFEGMR